MVELFVQQASLLRPVGEGGKLMLAADMAQVRPLSPSIKLQILLLCFHTYLTQVVGRSC